ncbi:UNVERIFIED_CONTAM: putative metal-binding protein [Acetivibrio alkalicellulosi]
MSGKVKFIQEVEIKKKKTILDIAQKNKIKIKSPCDGKGKCGKCIVKVVDGKVSEPTKAEINTLGDKKIKKGYRLACEAILEGDGKIVID